MSKDKSKRDIAPGKKPGPLTKKERNGKKREKKNILNDCFYTFLSSLKNPWDRFFKAIDVYRYASEGI